MHKVIQCKLTLHYFYILHCITNATALEIASDAMHFILCSSSAFLALSLHYSIICITCIIATNEKALEVMLG